MNKTDAYRPETPDVQDGAASIEPLLGYETTKAIQAALVVSSRPHILKIFTFPPFFSTHPIQRCIVILLQVFSKNLVKLNSRVVVSEDMRSAGLVLLEAALRADADLYQLTLSTPTALLGASAAALWVAIKFIGVRVTSPNGALMSQASQVIISILVEQEANLLNALEWGVSAVLRSKGIAMG